MTDEDLYAVHQPSLLRLFEAQARGKERVRLLEILEAEQQRCDREAGRRPRASNTTQGRRAAAMAAAINLLVPGNPWIDRDDECFASIAGSCDVVELYRYDPPTEPDEMPVRLLAIDGATDLVATVYMELDHAHDLGRALLDLVAQIRAERASRAASVPDQPAVADG